jgi:hypothetical protein
VLSVQVATVSPSARSPLFPNRVASALHAAGFNVCGVYCVDALFVTDAAKLIAGNLTALAAMVHLELPHINVLTKCDLVDREALERYLSPSGEALVAELGRAMGERFKRLNRAMARLVRALSWCAGGPRPARALLRRRGLRGVGWLAGRRSAAL